ncbi:MAG: polyprenol monophosphomannose synthase [Chloroflexi bacterium]|nr:polyprenol monophosphomannose synthase [Chloroflexota bacterium]
MKIAVVVPTYNEAKNLGSLVSRIEALGIPALRLIVVDDNSPDGTGELAERLARSRGDRMTALHRESKKGLGPAYIDGFRHALKDGMDIVIQMDADLSHAPEYIPLFLRRLETADVVVGSRYIVGGAVDRRWSLLRRFLSRFGNLYTRLVSGVQVRDATSGFKAFHRRVLEELNLDRFRCRGFAFQAEVALACERRNFRVSEMPIYFTDRAMGRSKMSWMIVWEALWRLPQLRWSPQAH